MANYEAFVSTVETIEPVPLADDCRFVLWRPSFWQPRPPTMVWKHALWSYAHYLHVFRSRDFALLCVEKAGCGLVHRSCVIPACFRWPFMAADDLQISSTWTEPAYRGGGLATKTLLQVRALMHKPGRRFWYVVRADNGASIAVCRKAGFQSMGEAFRTRGLGLNCLGQFVLAAARAKPILTPRRVSLQSAAELSPLTGPCKGL